MSNTINAQEVTEAGLELNEYVPCQLAALSTSIIRSVASLFEDWYDISIPEWKVMAIVAKHPGLSAVDVAQHAGLDTVAVSRAVTKLMDAGRISRQFGKEDRRRSMLELSEEGAELFQRITPMAVSLQESLLEDLTDQEKAVFEKALKSLSEKSQEFTQAFEAPPRPAAPKPRPSKTYNSENRVLPTPSLMARYISGSLAPVVR